MCRPTSRAEEAAVEIDREHLTPALGRQIHRRHAGAEPGVVDQHVDPAVPVHHRGDHGTDLGLVGDIQPVRLAAPDLVGDRPSRPLVDVAHRDMRPGLGQRVRGRSPDAAAATGDQRHPTVQAQHCEIIGYRSPQPGMPLSELCQAKPARTMPGEAALAKWAQPRPPVRPDGGSCRTQRSTALAKPARPGGSSPNRCGGGRGAQRPAPPPSGER
jgi:hypothetical protein